MTYAENRVRLDSTLSIDAGNRVANPATNLVAQWREQAQAYECDGQPGAKLLRRVAAELEQTWSQWWTEPLPISRAAAESGYSQDHLRELVRNGTVHPVLFADRGPIRIRRCDCPRKPGYMLKTS
jgi:hypothetical protein